MSFLYSLNEKCEFSINEYTDYETGSIRMKDFGTFDVLTDEEDTLYNRLSAIDAALEHLDYEINEAQQEIKMWRNKALDDKFKVKFWLIIALIFGFFSLPWYKLVLMAIPPGLDYTAAYFMNVIASFIALVTTFMILPVFGISAIVFAVSLALHILRNGKKPSVIKMAQMVGVDNRNVLIEEQKEIIKKNSREMEALKEEETKFKGRLDAIRKGKET